MRFLTVSKVNQNTQVPLKVQGLCFWITALSLEMAPIKWYLNYCKKNSDIWDKLPRNVKMLLTPESNVLPKPETWTSSAYFTHSHNYQLLKTSELLKRDRLNISAWFSPLPGYEMLCNPIPVRVYYPPRLPLSQQMSNKQKYNKQAAIPQDYKKFQT